MLLDRVPVVEHLVVPVGVAVINPLLTSVANFLDNPRTFRIFSLVVYTGKKLHHIVFCIAGIVDSCLLCSPEQVECIY